MRGDTSSAFGPNTGTICRFSVRCLLEAIANPTVADAILDRLVHNAHRLTLNGDSMRKAAAKTVRA